jgi:undecaprenyl-diphosphatase
MLERCLPEALLALDARLLLWLNAACYDSRLAFLVRHLADDAFLVTLVLALAVAAWRRGEQGRRTLLALLLMLVALNLLNTWLLKPFFGRPRPWDALPELRLMVTYKARSLSFPSTHSLMACAAALLIQRRLPPFGRLAWPAALAVMFFCVYSGGHYPLDVLAGGLLGALAGLGAARWLGPAGRAPTPSAFEAPCVPRS